MEPKVVDKVTDGILWVAGRDRFMPDSHIYVLGDVSSSDLTIIDCGIVEMGDYKLGELENHGISLEQVKRIIMTHTHLDHIGCLREFLDKGPHIQVWVHKDEATYLEQGDDRIVFGNKMFESMIRSQYSIPAGFFKFKVDRKLAGGEILDLGGQKFKVIHVPGHSIGSIGLYDETRKIFISGDTIYADGAIGRYDLFSADPDKLKESLEIIADLKIDTLLPCHNRIVKGGADQMIKNTVEHWLPMLR
jgi:glyoxylase-like metal-dependent hydrolase (beta-lactamase superfamily II)